MMSRRIESIRDTVVVGGCYFPIRTEAWKLTSRLSERALEKPVLELELRKKTSAVYGVASSICVTFSQFFVEDCTKPTAGPKCRTYLSTAIGTCRLAVTTALTPCL